MIVSGVVLLILVWALSQIFPTAAPPVPALEHVGWVIGVILVVLGIVLWVFGHFTGRAVGGRRYWY